MGFFCPRHSLGVPRGRPWPNHSHQLLGCPYLKQKAIKIGLDFILSFEGLSVIKGAQAWNPVRYTEWLGRLTANAKDATVRGSILASSVTVESERRQLKQCSIKYRTKKSKISPFNIYSPSVVASTQLKSRRNDYGLDTASGQHRSFRPPDNIAYFWLRLPYDNIDHFLLRTRGCLRTILGIFDYGL